MKDHRFLDTKLGRAAVASVFAMTTFAALSTFVLFEPTAALPLAAIAVPG
ncbi:MAG: hypothetical protein V2J51_13855 [Erythrobacter sp.]|jgi:hypothetical protein|nr:hypothetical protein [Erythrobacter sp.]